MTLLIMRHGMAVPGDFRTPDEGRWLTESGRQSALRAGEAIRSEGLTVDTVVSSPLVRAVQTAELAARAMGFSQSIPSLQSLRSEESPSRALDDLRAAGGVILAVTHEPMASALCALVSGISHGSLRTAEIRGFEGDSMSWRFVG
jgi:phosphohistidine phosphatase